MALDETEIKKDFEELNKLVKSFRDENDKGRKADKETLSRIEADLAKADERVNAAAAAQKTLAEEQKKQIESLEKAIGRLKLGAPGTDKEKFAEEQKAIYGRLLREGSEKIGDEIKRAVEGKTLVKGDDSAGGYLAPPDFLMEIIKAEVLQTPARSLARVLNTSRRSVQVPKRTTAATATRVAEIGTRTETTNPAFALMEISAGEMTAQTRVSYELLEDSEFNLEEFLAQEFGEQFGVLEGTEFITGTGANGKMLGLQSGNLSSTNSGTAANVKDVDGQGDGIIDCAHALKSPYAARASWLLNRSVLGAVRKLKDSQKQYIWQAGVAIGNPSTIAGYPYFEAPDMDNEGAGKFPMAIGDWKRAFYMVDRLQLAITRDAVTLADSGQVKFVARRRVGGAVVLAEAARFLKCST